MLVSGVQVTFLKDLNGSESMIQISGSIPVYVYCLLIELPFSLVSAQFGQ